MLHGKIACELEKLDKKLNSLVENSATRGHQGM